MCWGWIILNQDLNVINERIYIIPPASGSERAVTNHYLVKRAFKGFINLQISLLFSVMISAVPFISWIKPISRL
jgi:hypothetical protein